MHVPVIAVYHTGAVVFIAYIIREKAARINQKLLFAVIITDE